METNTGGFFNLLIPLPPNPKVKEEIRNKLLGENFDQYYTETDIFEGLIFGWRDWYGFTNSEDTGSLQFRSRLEGIYEKYEEEMLAIDWRDEDDYEYIDLQNNKQYAEVFSMRYEKGDCCITVFPDFLRISVDNKVKDVSYHYDLAYAMKDDLRLAYEKIWRRGILR